MTFSLPFHHGNSSRQGDGDSRGRRNNNSPHQQQEQYHLGAAGGGPPTTPMRMMPAGVPNQQRPAESRGFFSNLVSGVMLHSWALAMMMDEASGQEYSCFSSKAPPPPPRRRAYQKHLRVAQASWGMGHTPQENNNNRWDMVEEITEGEVSGIISGRAVIFGLLNTWTVVWMCGGAECSSL